MPFLPFVYGYPSSSPRAHCTPNKSVPTLRNTRGHGPVHTGHACRHLPSTVLWISEDRLFTTVSRAVCRCSSAPAALFSLGCVSLVLSPLTISASGCISHKTGRLVQLIVQGNSLFNVVEQETCVQAPFSSEARTRTSRALLSKRRCMQHPGHQPLFFSATDPVVGHERS